MTTTPAMPELHRDQIIDLISPLSKNSADHDIEFANRVIDALATLQAQPADVSDAKWDGAEEWMPLAWELCAEEHGEEACNELIWTGGPIPEPWGDRWLQYEDEAKRVIALVRKHVPSLRPQAVPMTDERLAEVLTTAYGSPEWTMDDVRAARAVEAAALGITAPAGGEG